MILSNGTIIRSFSDYSSAIKFTEGDFVVFNNSIYKVNELTVTGNNDEVTYLDNVEVMEVNGNPVPYVSVSPLASGGDLIYTCYASPQSEGIAGLEYLTGSKAFDELHPEVFLSFLTFNKVSLTKIPSGLVSSVFHVSSLASQGDYYCMAINQLIPRISDYGIQVVLIAENGTECIVSTDDIIEPLDIPGYDLNIPDFRETGGKRMTFNDNVRKLYDLMGKYITMNQCGFTELYSYSTFNVNDYDDSDTVTITGSNDGYSVMRVIVDYVTQGTQAHYQETIELYTKLTRVNIDGKKCSLNYEYINDGYELTATKTSNSVDKLKIVTVLGLTRVEPITINQYNPSIES